jgi:branched-chain amino acid transport system substrate-binding protein
MSRRKLLTVILAGVVGAALGLRVAPGSAQHVLGKDAVVIGWATSLKRDFGISQIDGAKMAVEEINAAGGILGSTVKLVLADTNTSAPGATSAIRKLIDNDKVDVVMGAFLSEEATSFQAEAANRRFLTIFHGTPAVMDDQYLADPQKYKYYFNFVPSDVHIAQAALAQLPLVTKTLQKRLGISKVKVALVSDAALWTQTIDAYIKKEVEQSPDAEFVYQGKIGRDASDFTTELSQIKAKQAHFIIMLSGYAGSVPFVKQWRTLQIPALIGGILTKAQNPNEFWKAVGIDGAQYIITVGFANFGINENTKKLIQRYTERQGWWPIMDSGVAYNAVKAYARAVEQAKSLKHDVVVPYLEKVRLNENEAWGGAYFYDKHRRVHIGIDGVVPFSVQFSTDPKGRLEVITPDKLKTADLLVPEWMIKR